ncbi:MAG: hypothetical protein K0S81_823 [Rhodospirillales bacterium]|nr:hypothetical protein [Rhodospirillales bacterium]
MPSFRAHRLLLAALAAGACASGATAAADPVTVGGVTFSDERGGFVILSASGEGTYDNPFLVVEEITDPEGAVLVMRGSVQEIGNRIGTLHQTGFALTKIVINGTGEAWTLFDMELQELYGVASDYYDGLSFGQAAKLRRPFISDRFEINETLNEPHDEIRFRDGTVDPGDRLTVTFVVTDATPIPEFFLLQRPSRLISALPRRLASR